MKKFKIVLWVIIIAFLVLVFFQNRMFFEMKQGLKLNLYVTGTYHSPELPTAVWFLVALCVGFLIAYFFALIEKFRTNKIIKGLKAKSETQDALISQLKNELASQQAFQGGAAAEDETAGTGSSPGTEKP